MSALVAHLLNTITSLVPTSIAVTIAAFVFKLAMHAIGDADRWNRFLIIAVPTMIFVFALAGIATWWLVWDGGAQLLLAGHTARLQNYTFQNYSFVNE